MKRSIGIPMALLVATAALFGCSEPDVTPRTASIGLSAVSQESPGRWADEFDDALRRSTTEFERTALADGVISEGEFAKLEDAFATCLRGNNVAFGGFEIGGGYEFAPGQGTTTKEANSIADDCSASTGLDTVGSLHFAMQRNPRNLDDSEIIAACLVKKRVVPGTYSAADYERDSRGMEFPFTDRSTGERILESCTADPLGLLESHPR